MKITEVKVTPVDDKEQLKAYVTIVLDQSFVVRDVKVIMGPSGLFVAMPSKRRRDGSFRDVAHPINREARDELEAAVLKAYRKSEEKRRAKKSRPSGEEKENANRPEEAPAK